MGSEMSIQFGYSGVGGHSSTWEREGGILPSEISLYCLIVRVLHRPRACVPFCRRQVTIPRASRLGLSLSLSLSLIQALPRTSSSALYQSLIESNLRRSPLLPRRRCGGRLSNLRDVPYDGGRRAPSRTVSQDFASFAVAAARGEVERLRLSVRRVGLSILSVTCSEMLLGNYSFSIFDFSTPRHFVVRLHSAVDSFVQRCRKHQRIGRRGDLVKVGSGPTDARPESGT
jgi:hypothetical protein